ncbi:hypothetical protein Egran_05607 [Elaphomyces granulatus]|uniref:F-box domain-containing protein n=1 Tax=Elaphomyces granulatus TaxID=519963 RepID=A0A232LRI2_9EURO|nr:hypothetical protein Egran_05607 [Elaphomyces granulatus]
MGRHLHELPDEILHSILRFSSPTSSIALGQTARKFQRITNEPLLWRFYCQSLFTFWDKRHELPKMLASPVYSVNWKQLYVMRHIMDSSITQTLNSILSSQTGRIEKFEVIINFGYDAKDTLIRHSLAINEDDCLARSNAILGCLHRNIALLEWFKLRNGGPVPLERALGVFDLFIPESGISDLDDITLMLNKIVLQLQAEHPAIECLTPREKALVIASNLRANHLTGMASGRDYLNLEHSFLGMALNGPSHNSLPLISAAIYCYVAQKFGLNARPCCFPLHVHVIITPEPGTDLDGNILIGDSKSDPMYVDPFRSSNETAVSDLQSQLNFLGASVFEHSNFLGESLTSEVVLRCAKNILNSTQDTTRSSQQLMSPNAVGAKYAALWSIILFASSRPTELRQYLPWLTELFATDFPFDVFLIERHALPLFWGLVDYEHLLETLRVMRTVDKIPKQVKVRTSRQKNIRYRVGQVFRHRRYNYRAIITGWDAECSAGEQWMMRMGIDRLQAGRHQSFYHTLVEDRSVRYVAEENIEIVTPRISDLPPTLSVVAGKHFRKWDEKTRTFVSNIRDEYPDD